MFIFAPLTEITWPVTIRVPLDGGKFNDVEVSIRYKRFTSTEQAALIAECKNTGELLKKVIVGWDAEEFGNPDGSSIEFNEQNLESLIDVDYICRALRYGFFNASAGVLEKN